LILFGNTLFGTAASGGSLGNGTVFALNTDGTGFTNLHSFTDSDGALPYAGLFLTNNTLYGTAVRGGGSGGGTVLRGNKPGHNSQSVSFVSSRRNVRNLLWSLHLGVTPVQFRRIQPSERRQ
jgi:uncharacterized repeat protein (TIGR03803 family)